MVLGDMVLWALTDYLNLETENEDVPDHTSVISIDFLFCMEKMLSIFISQFHL